MKCSKNYVMIRKMGGFYQVFDEDAYLLFYLFKYKIINSKAGFPLISLNKVIKILDEKKINYIVIKSDLDKDTKDFRRKNSYDYYLKLSKEFYNLEIKKQSIEDKIKTLPLAKIEKLYNIIEEFINE